MRHTLQDTINHSYDDQAKDYDTQDGHRIDAVESELWKAEVLPPTQPQPDCSVLDVGAGTGVFSNLWLEWGAAVTCLEPAEKMLEKARANLSGKVSFVLGDTHDLALFPGGGFDFIVSRQAACYFRDPLLVFQNWQRWLKPGGQIVLVDGLWFRDGWSDDHLVDQLPLSCLQTRATIAYLLEKSGFQILENKWLDQVNAYLSGIGQSKSPRYKIAAKKVE
jgi:ubiquinone/menaquinone biosynthesis C-methylase UbiE